MFLQAGTGAVPRTIQDKAREIVSVKDFGAVGGASNETSVFQLAANAAKAVGAALLIPKGAGAYKIDGVDIAGLEVIADPGVTFSSPAGATGHAFVAVGTAISRVTTPTTLRNIVHDGGSSQLGLVRAEYCDDIVIESCIGSGYPMTALNDGQGIALTECLRPKVIRCKVSGGRMGVIFASCTSPQAQFVTTSGQGRDGIAFYSDPAGTLTTDALAVGCVATDYCINGEGGRAGLHFYGVRRALCVGCSASDDNGQANDDTAGIRFRDCEDFSAVGYSATNCRTGVLVNEVGDYAAAGIVVRGAIGAGSVDNIGKYGIAVAATNVPCSVSGAKVSNVADVVGGAGIYHSGTGAVSGCMLTHMAVPGVAQAGFCSITGNTFLCVGKGASSVPAVNVTGTAVVSGNAFIDDRGAPTSTLAIRILSGGAGMIGPNLYGTGITDFVIGSPGSTTKRGSTPIRQKFAGVPGSLSGTIESGVMGTDTNGVDFVYRAGAWRRLDLRTVTATIGVVQTAVAHGLGYVPTTVAVQPAADARVWESAVADATNVYLTASASASCKINVQ